MVTAGADQAMPRVTARRVIVEGVLLMGSLLWKGMGSYGFPALWFHGLWCQGGDRAAIVWCANSGGACSTS